MKNILVIFTGGTIGSTVQYGAINTNNNTHFVLLEKYYQRYPQAQTEVNFTFLQPYQILSENLAPQTWMELITAIEKAKPTNYDGIIITHGTDTLAYSAAALGFYFHALSVPLFLVSSYLPLSEENANGLDNFSLAIKKIIEEDLTGVFVPYKNPEEKEVRLHHATRLMCSPQLSDHFFSVSGINAPPQYSVVPVLNAHFSDRILLIKPYPSLNYDYFNLENIDAVLHDLYHSGTACTTLQWGENHTVLNFIKRCHAKKIAIYFAPIFKSTNAYQTTIELVNMGATMCWNMTLEAVFVKLSLAYGNFTDLSTILSFMELNLAREHVIK